MSRYHAESALHAGLHEARSQCQREQHRQEKGVVRRKSAEDCDGRQKENAGNQWPFASEPVSERTEDEHACGAKGQRERKRIDDGRLADVEVAASESRRKMTTKKSKASRNHPRIPEPTANGQPFV